MIGVFATGQMGNQMFEYAFGYSASKKLHKKFFMYGGESLRYFELFEELERNNRWYIPYYSLINLFRRKRFDFIIAGLKGLKNPLGLFFNWDLEQNLISWDNTFDEKNYFLSEIKDNTVYQGLFQSEKYFKDFERDIKQKFTIREQYRTPFLKDKMPLFAKKTVVVHLRRTDYTFVGSKDFGGTDISLPIQYYKNCLGMIDNLDSHSVIFISDDIDFAKKEFGGKANYIFEHNDAITDFQLMLYADIVIIANSSYSWWAAWLNDKKDKIIYAPNYFLGFKVKKFYPAGIKVDSWNWINVD